MTRIVNDERLRAIARSCPEYHSKFGLGTGALSATAGTDLPEIRCDACVHFNNGLCDIYQRKIEEN